MDRDRIEAHLSDAQLEALAESCADLGHAVEDWPDVPVLRTWAVHVAGARCVREIMFEYGVGQTAAIARAEVRLGLGERSLESALRRAGALPSICSRSTDRAA